MIANSVAKAIDSTDTEIVIGTPDRMSGAQIAEEGGVDPARRGDRDDEAADEDEPGEDEDRAGTLRRARARDAAIARTMASGPPATTSS